MAEFQLVMPKMGEGIIEATILSWSKKPGDIVNENEIILEVATDKVDSEIPSPVSGTVKKLLFKEEDTVAVDSVIAIIEVEGEIPVPVSDSEEDTMEEKTQDTDSEDTLKNETESETKEEKTKHADQPETVEIPYTPRVESSPSPDNAGQIKSESDRFYSPLVRNIAQAEGISQSELNSIPGTGLEGRVTKDDILNYIKKKQSGQITSSSGTVKPVSSFSGQDEIIEMDRMRRLIAKNMIDSKRISAHVSSFVEVDMTAIVSWREKHKTAFKQREGYSLTYMPIVTEAIVKAIKDFPMINISVDGDKIIKKKNINIGIATALPSGNLIVPVVKNADRMNLMGLASQIRQVTEKARNNQLRADDIQGGTYSISNIGTFGNILGTPIIPQPQVAIMAIGAITKKPVVLETTHGDVIAIRHMMYLSHTYDHRVVDGALGGMFVKRVAEYLENFDLEQEI